MKDGFFLSTDMVDEKIRDEFWVDTSRIIYDVGTVEDQPTPGLTGSVRSRLFGNMVVGDTTFNSQICRRTPEIVRQSNLDLVLLQVIISGDYVGDFNGTNLSAQAGDVFFLDLAQVLESQKNPGRRVTLAIPRENLSSLLSKHDLHGVVLKKDVATNRLLSDYILGIGSTLEFMRHDEVPAVQESLMTLIHAAIRGTAKEDLRDLNINLPMRRRILDFIARNLSKHELSPTTIMQQFHVSHSHLYRAFEADGGVARVIRNKRLDVAYEMLSRDQSRQMSLKHVRGKLGFSDRSQFSRFFKDRFGASPQDIQGSSQPVLDNGSVPLALHDYVLGKVRKLQT